MAIFHFTITFIKTKFKSKVNWVIGQLEILLHKMEKYDLRGYVNDLTNGIQIVEIDKVKSVISK